MVPDLGPVRGFANALRGVRKNRRVARDPGARARMLFYEPNPDLRRDLSRSGVLQLRPPKREVDVPSSAFASAERVRAAYRLAAVQAEEYPGSSPSGQWGRLIARSHGDLIRALEGDDLAVLATTLERMFAARTTTGLSMGGELGYLLDSSGRDFYVDWWIDGLYCLASYLELLPETMDTAQSPITSVAAFAALHRAVVERLGLGLDFPAVCSAWGIEFQGVLTPRTAWRHLHAAHAMLNETASLGAPRIVEVGGGFGGVAYWIQRLRPDTVEYAMYDFPIVNAIAGYFLLRALPARLVVLNGEPTEPGAPQIAVLPNWRIFQEPDCGADIAFNQDSLPEMPREAALRYLEVFDRIVRVGFYSENQEDAHQWDPGDAHSAQLRLPDLENAMQRLRRASRFRAWMRRGYFETLYRPRPEPPG
jgi:hypothetical protein